MREWNEWIFWIGFGAALFATLTHIAFGSEWTWVWPALTAYYMWKWKHAEGNRYE